MKCFYHNADMDGICSGAIFHHKYEDDIELIGIDYGDDFPWDTIQKDEKVYMVDVSLDAADMKRLKDLADFVWIDHHKSAIDEMKSEGLTFTGIQKVGQAGCELAWWFLYPNKDIPHAVRLLGRYDVWDWQDKEGCLEFQYGARSLLTTPTNHYWSFLLDNTLAGYQLIDQLIENGRAILGYIEQYNKKYCNKTAFETQIAGHKAIAVNCDLTNSQMFDSVWDEGKYDIMLTFVRRPKHWKCSMYTTKDDIDCSVVARSFGGGGHQKAAGFICDSLPFQFAEQASSEQVVQESSN